LADVQVRNVGKTLVTRSSGMRVATEFLKGRICEANLADLNKDEDQNYRKITLQILVSSSPPSLFLSPRIYFLSSFRSSSLCQPLCAHLVCFCENILGSIFLFERLVSDG
jgi:hypothetical protein